MHIGVVGSEGVVGGACKFGFELIGHTVSVHDITIGTSIEGILGAEVVFICVPTPPQKDGDCDTSIVESVVRSLRELKYGGVIAVKSTVSLGTTERFIKQYGGEICFVPEFLKERSARIDFCERHDLCIIGTNSEATFNIIKECHGSLPKKVIRLTPTEAESCKYMNNSLGATLVTFANSFNMICEKYGVDYSKVQSAMSNRDFFPKAYLVSNSKWLGWCGPCWSKDVPALARMSEGTNVEFFSDLVKENDKYQKTVPEGMRKF